MRFLWAVCIVLAASLAYSVSENATHLGILGTIDRYGGMSTLTDQQPGANHTNSTSYTSFLGWYDIMNTTSPPDNSTPLNVTPPGGGGGGPPIVINGSQNVTLGAPPDEPINYAALFASIDVMDAVNKGYAFLARLVPDLKFLLIFLGVVSVFIIVARRRKAKKTTEAKT